MQRKKKRKVIIVLWLAGSAGRKQLSGILQFVNHDHPWTIRLITEPKEFTAEVIRDAEKDGVDGFIVHADNHSAESLAESQIPTVLIDFPPPRLLTRSRALAILLDSDERIGAVAAEYFLRLGNFGSYAFVPDAANRGWSRLRERGFKNALQRLKLGCQVYSSDKGTLVGWLKALPKPAAVLCAYDLKARETIEVCRQHHLAVPTQVAVLGVDNDELICDYAKPSLSSVRIDHEALGREAAHTLNRLMNRPDKEGLIKLFMPVGEVVERESTAPIAPAAHLVARAQAFVHDHAADGIHVEDVIKHLGVSRRLADRRFGEATGSSIRRSIEDRRLELVCQRLQTTSISIEKISRLCGYANAQRLKYVFKARFGMSMSNWRRQFTKN